MSQGKKTKRYAEKAKDFCREVFLDGDPDRDDKLIIASYFCGLSIAYSQVGICHALSYGLSFVLGLHHSIGNCVAFDYLEEFHPEKVSEFRRIMGKHGRELPRNLVTGLERDKLDKMVDVALVIEP